MDKIILIHYIDISEVHRTEVEQYITEVVNNISNDPSLKSDDIIKYFITTKEGGTRVECINPKLVSEEDFKEAKEALDRHMELLNPPKKEVRVGILSLEEDKWYIKWSGMHSFTHGTHWEYTPISKDYPIEAMIYSDGDLVEYEIVDRVINEDTFEVDLYAKVLNKK